MEETSNTGLSLSKAGNLGTDWYHKSTGLVAPTDAVKAELKLGVQEGEAWIDNVMFEGGSGRSGNILVSNQSFDFDADQTKLADDWYPPGEGSTGIAIDHTVKKHGIASESIVGVSGANRYVKQPLNLSGPKGSKFNLSGWSKQQGVPASGGSWILQLEFHNLDGTMNWIGIPFDRSNQDWQYVSRVIEAPKDFLNVSVIPALNQMPATAKVWFDDVKVSEVDIPSSTISTYNYADNSSFEYDYDLSGWADGWYRSSQYTPLTSEWVDLTNSSGNVYTGSHAIKMTNPSGWESITRTDEKVPYDGSKSFSAIGYIKTENVSSSAVILVHAYDESGNWIGQVASPSVSGTKDWTRVTAVVNSSSLPAGTKSIAVGAQMRAGTGVTYFDNIRLQEGDNRTRFEYDALGNYVTGVTNSLGQKESFAPDTNKGTITSYTDALGNQSTYEYNGFDDVTKMTFPYTGAFGASKVNKSFQYAYDLNGNLETITDPNGKIWATYAYNEWDLPKQFSEKVSIGGSTNTYTWEYQYDTSGRPKKTIMPTGQYAETTYDLADRMTGMAFGNGTTPTHQYQYAYDLNGNMTSFGKASSLFKATYDEINQVKKVTEPTTTNYTENEYDFGGNRTNLNVQFGSTSWKHEYEYDGSGLPASFKDVATGQQAWFLYDESQRMVKSYNTNKTATFYEYDEAGRLEQLRTEVAGETVDKFRYEFDALGDITKIWSDIDNTWTEYAYDSIGQLVREKTSSGTTIEYRYDELGNRMEVIRDGVSTAYAYNAEKNRLQSVGNKSYAYDASGNTLSDSTYTYVWGDHNKLQQVKQGASTIASYNYDALGRRETSVVGSVTKTYHYDGELVTYVTQSDGKIYRFAYDHEGRPLFISYQNKQYWYHYDEHGNVIRLTDSTGATIASYKYDAWGNITNKWSASGNEIVDLNPYRYSGYWYDNETGKYYLHARYYDPQIGRFLSKDRINVSVGEPTGLNAYTYVSNNPVSYIDPTGEIKGILGYVITFIKNLSKVKVKKVNITSIIPNIGFKSFDALKRHLGHPGNGNAWHHIVEQSQIKSSRSGFAPSNIHNVRNIIAIPHGKGSIHSEISRIYSMKAPGLFGKGTIRDWMSGKSFDEQLKFGIDMLKQFGEVKATSKGWKFTPFK